MQEVPIGYRRLELRQQHMLTGEVPIGTINTLELAENDIITQIQADFFQPVGRKIISYIFFSNRAKEESFRLIFFIKWEGRKFQTDSLNGDTFRQVF